MKSKKICLILSILSAFTVVSCNEKIDNENTITIEDLLGREVNIPTQINKVVCIGAGALRYYSYVGDMSKLCGVEDVDKDNSGIGKNLAIRPYKMVNADLFNSLPSCGVGGPSSQVAEAEKILSCNPDIIISLITDAEAMDKLQNETKIPVVTLSYGKTEAFDQNVTKSINLLGKILNREDRANEITSYINNIVKDLDDKTKDIKEEDKSSIYIGCQSNYGTHGIESSTAQYSIFNVSHIKNVLDANGYEGYQRNVDLEALLTMDPDKIIIDAGGLELLKSQYLEDEKSSIFNSMSAFKNNEVYLQMPYNAYYTNLEIAYINAYFDACVSYPEVFNEFNYIDKAREILTKFLGKDCYDDIASSLYGGYQKLDLASTFEKYGK